MGYVIYETNIVKLLYKYISDSQFVEFPLAKYKLKINRIYLGIFIINIVNIFF